MTADRGSLVCWLAVSFLSLVGLGLATYLSVGYLSGQGPACGPDSGCEVVTMSRYAVFLGIPVAMIGVAGYSVLLLGSLTIVSSNNLLDPLRKAILGASGVGFGFSAYLTGTQAMALHAFCIYCLTSASIMTLILVLTLVGWVLGRSSN